GVIWRAPGTEASLLSQDTVVKEPEARSQSVPTVFDLVAGGLGRLREAVVAYHHAAHAVAEDPSEKNLGALGAMQQALEDAGGWSVEQRVELVLSRLALDADAVFETLS